MTRFGAQICPAPDGLASPVLVFHEHIEALHKRLSTSSKNDAITLVYFAQRTMNDIVGFVATFQLRNEVEKTEIFVGFITAQRRAKSVTGIPYSIVKYAQSESLFEIQSFLGVKDERVTKYDCNDLKGRFERGIVSDPAPNFAAPPAIKKEPIFDVNSFVDTAGSFVNLDDDLEEVQPNTSSNQPKSTAANEIKSVSAGIGESNGKNPSASQPSNAASDNGKSASAGKTDDPRLQILPVFNFEQPSKSVPTEVVVNMRTFSQPIPAQLPMQTSSSASNASTASVAKDSAIKSIETSKDSVASIPINNIVPKSTISSSFIDSVSRNDISSRQPRSIDRSSKSQKAPSTKNESQIGQAANPVKPIQTENSASKEKSEADNSLSLNYDYIRDLYDRYANYLDAENIKPLDSKQAKGESAQSPTANVLADNDSSSSSKNLFNQPSGQSLPHSQAPDSIQASPNQATSASTNVNSSSRNNNNRIDIRDPMPSATSHQNTRTAPLPSPSVPSNVFHGFQQHSATSGHNPTSASVQNQNSFSKIEPAKEDSFKPAGRYPTYSELYGDLASSLPTIEDSLTVSNRDRPRPQNTSQPSAIPNSNASSEVSYEKLLELLRKAQETEAQQVQLIKKLKDETELIQKLHLILAYIRRQEESNQKSLPTGRIRPTEFLFNNLSRSNNHAEGSPFDGVNLGPELDKYTTMSSAELSKIVAQKERFVSLLTNLLVRDYKVIPKSSQPNSPPAHSNTVIYGPVNSFSNVLVDGRAGRIIPLEQTRAVRLTQSISNPTFNDRNN